MIRCRNAIAGDHGPAISAARSGILVWTRKKRQVETIFGLYHSGPTWDLVKQEPVTKKKMGEEGS